ncbi:MAG: hypothetical protein L3J18_05475 [Candidatus Brocadia sp.]|uniref:FlgN protein n=1 Tax=Candidatus Brocadia fulgida TaxID=380242 RepID=A0A0M2UX70_9BACT|nr:MAG: hypothetical protein BROFUL_00610 [Candidatus Brocadia fulgida]UJS21760.1 MAG: hypothetical protein L3J18_05475 [Candidatus Brocadia sp.]
MDKKKKTEILSALALDYEILFNHTLEIKKVLLNDLSEGLLETIFEKRGLLLERMSLSIKYYNPINEFCNFTDSIRQDSEIDELLHKIKQKSNAITVLNEEIASLIKQHINNITSYLVKLREGKHYMDTIKMHYNITSSLIDMCG